MENVLKVRRVVSDDTAHLTGALFNGSCWRERFFFFEESLNTIFMHANELYVRTVEEL